MDERDLGGGEGICGVDVSGGVRVGEEVWRLSAPGSLWDDPSVTYILPGPTQVLLTKGVGG